MVAADPGTRRRFSYLPTLLVLGASLLVLAVLNPHLLVSSNTPTGGDMGAHVLGPAYLRDVLLPQGRILGWSDSWFAGFPAFYFYFPLPSLVIVFLDVFLPYGVAFKIVTVLGLLAMPPATAYMVRCFGASRQLSAVAAAGAVAFVLMESFTIYGGNVASTMAGEFSFSWSFALGMVYLGLLGRAIDDRRYVRWAALTLGLTALSHILTTIVLVMASLPVLFRRRAWSPAIRIWAWGFAIAGFWAVPVLARIGLTADMGWNPLSRWEEIFPIELWFPLPLALVGMVLFTKRYPRSLPILFATMIPIIYYPLPNLLPSVIPSLGEGHWKLWNGRLLPYWYFGINLFAALAVGLAIGWVARRLPERVSPWWGRALLAGLMGGLGWLLVFREAPLAAGIGVGAAGVVIAGVMSLVDTARVPTKNLLATVGVLLIGVGALAGTNFVYKWARWNYSGYEAKEFWPEYNGIMNTVGALPAGRIQWEQDSTDGTGLNKYGTPMAPMLFPYWTEWTHQSMEGLFFESSLTTPFMFLASNEMSLNGSTPVSGLDYHGFDFDRGIPHMELYGVRYYVSYSEDAAAKADGRPELEKVAESPPFTVYQLNNVDLVEPAEYQPAVFEPVEGGPVDFDDFSFDWYSSIETLNRPVVADGPEEWPTVSTAADVPSTPTGATTSDVSDVVFDDHRISFTTSAVGVPHLVKMSYFPNWKAQGAEGPYRVTPTVMLVVPTEEEVLLEFGTTWAELVGNLLTVGGLGLLGYVWWSRRRVGQHAADPPEPA